MTNKKWNSSANAYVVAVVTVGAATVVHSMYALLQAPVTYLWFLLAGLTLLSGSFTVRIPNVPARLSVSEAFVFAAVLLFGPAAATMIVVLDCLVASFWLAPRSRQITRVLFNTAAPSIAIWVSSNVFYYWANIVPLGVVSQPILSLIWPLVALAVLYFLLNSLLIARAVAFEHGTSTLHVWQQNFLWLSLNYFSGASVAALLLPYLQHGQGQQQLLRVIGIFLPLLLISYLTFKTALGRVDDANKHLTELNQLYLSTIETLAMAIDAKDQITHGHIRRVQIYATALAKEMGVTEKVQLSAIEAASLLHDMGKLAVPEYILNKPGRLTKSEFEKMKLHASVGADILSAIDFPYPVVPIVRHHHENWDGTGYPDGLKGSQIPIGARILSVVDCFDALTSDRPYRPRLSEAEATRILTERRGSMYDPLVIDTFMRVHSQIVPTALNQSLDSSPNAGLSAIARGLTVSESLSTGSGLDDIAASTEEMLVLYDLARGLTGHVDLADAADVISKHIRRILPAATCVFYIYDEELDELHAAHASGENGSHFSGLRIARGERLTGWVAANKQTILNSDPVLDLGEVARSFQPRLRSCLSTPLLNDTELVGVLTVYSTHKDAFTEDHRRIIEVVARQVTQTVTHAVAFEDRRSAAFRDQLTGLPNRSHLTRFIASEIAAGGASAELAIIVVDLDSLKLLNRRHGRPAGDRALARVAEAIRSVLRGADILFRYDSDEFVVLLTQTTAGGANIVADRIASTIADMRKHSSNAEEQAISATLTVASAPSDGNSLEQLVMAARQRESKRPDDGTPRTSIH